MTTDDDAGWHTRVLRAAGGSPGESTSARLARVERERDDAVRRCADLEQVREELKHRRALADGYAEDVQQLEGERVRLVDEKGTLRNENETVRAELGRLRAENDRLIAKWANVARSNWIVSRDGGRDCVRCEQEIRRNDAYELLDGVDELVHIHCPTDDLTAVRQQLQEVIHDRDHVAGERDAAQRFWKVCSAHRAELQVALHDCQQALADAVQERDALRGDA